MNDVKDFLAIVLIGAGSSFARGPEKEDAIARCLRIAQADWGSLYDLSEKPVKVNVYDVTGYDAVWWDTRGLWSGEEPLDVPHEVIDRTFQKAKRR